MFTLYSIFDSLDGEISAFHQGALTTFIRFSGCNIHCGYCDTVYALKKNDGRKVSLDQLTKELFQDRPNLKKVTITGGEPLLQLELDRFIDILLDKSIKISIETNGTRAPIERFLNLPEVCWVVDFKLLSSGERNRMNPKSFNKLTENDFVKFVIFNLDDTYEALQVAQLLRSDGCKAKFAFSPVHSKLSPDSLFKWLMEFGSGDEIINLQLHKYIWPDSKEEH